MFSLKGKVAAISGAASGIGYQVARAYAEAGAGVAMFYNSNKNAIEKAAALAKEFNVKVIAYQVPRMNFILFKPIVYIYLTIITIWLFSKYAWNCREGLQPSR